MVFSDARYRAVNTFILDTTRLGEESLARLGLDATDSAATDHRPVIVDLAPR
jgi:prophage tail gpP-like protein